MEVVLLILHGWWAGTGLKDRVKCRAVGLKSKWVMEPPHRRLLILVSAPSVTPGQGRAVSAVPGPRWATLTSDKVQSITHPQSLTVLRKVMGDSAHVCVPWLQDTRCWVLVELLPGLLVPLFDVFSPCPTRTSTQILCLNSWFDFFLRGFLS